MLRTFSLHVTGKVQGVFYRQHTKETARELGLTGTVMNLPDGSVNIIVTGPEEQVNKLTEWCRHGPARATVENVVVKELPLQEFEEFKVIRRE